MFEASDANKTPLGEEHALNEHGFQGIAGTEALVKLAGQAKKVGFGFTGEQDGFGI